MLVRIGLLLALLGVVLLLWAGVRSRSSRPLAPPADRAAKGAGWTALAVGLAALAAAWIKHARGRGRGPDTRPPDTRNLFR
jgi:drug/metabolite transporter (DMT)-like permease